MIGFWLVPITRGMAGMAKWLRLRIVVPAFVGSSPITCPIKNKKAPLWCLFVFRVVEVQSPQVSQDFRYEWLRRSYEAEEISSRLVSRRSLE